MMRHDDAGMVFSVFQCGGLWAQAYPVARRKDVYREHGHEH
jgi:hypothetical protein